MALKAALDSSADYILLLEDDLDFNRHIRHNLQNWTPLKRRAVTVASLFNPGLREAACDVQGNFRIVQPRSIFGSQAFLISRPALRHIVTHWNRVSGMQEMKISRLAATLGQPVLYHAPSLVQHIGTPSLSGLRFHEAMDFEATWRV